MMGQTVAEPLNEGAESSKAGPEKLQRRAAARKIGKMIRRCKAETNAIKRLDDEQNKYLERMRKR
jgi:Sec-independent protein translocase protein TatA